MDYSKWTDFEINRAVGEVTLKGRWVCKPGTAANNTDSWYYGSVDQFVTPYPELPDYCNNPADAWQIIVDNGISLECIVVNRHEKTWRAQFKPAYVKHHMNDKNPLRAAMIVFLMMQESE